MYLKYARLVKIYNFPSVKELFRLIRGAPKVIFGYQTALDVPSPDADNPESNR